MGIEIENLNPQSLLGYNCLYMKIDAAEALTMVFKNLFLPVFPFLDSYHFTLQ